MSPDWNLLVWREFLQVRASTPSFGDLDDNPAMTTENSRNKRSGLPFVAALKAVAADVAISAVSLLALAAWHFRLVVFVIVVGLFLIAVLSS